MIEIKEVKNNPLYKLQVKRDTLRTVLLVMEKYNIVVPIISIIITIGLLVFYFVYRKNRI